MARNRMVERKKKEVATIDDSESGVSYAKRLSIHTTHLLELGKPNLDNAYEVELAVNNYFLLCQQDEVRPTVSGLAMALGVSRATLLKYANGTTRVNNREIIVMALQTIEIFDEAMLKEGLMPALAGIFLFKNNYGYTDKTELVAGTEELTDEEIEKRYRERHEIVSDVENK